MGVGVWPWSRVLLVQPKLQARCAGRRDRSADFRLGMAARLLQRKEKGEVKGEKKTTSSPRALFALCSVAQPSLCGTAVPVESGHGVWGTLTPTSNGAARVTRTRAEDKPGAVAVSTADRHTATVTPASFPPPPPSKFQPCGRCNC